MCSATSASIRSTKTRSTSVGTPRLLLVDSGCPTGPQLRIEQGDGARRLWIGNPLNEDPTPGLGGMAEVAAEAKMPLATNMCVVAFDHLEPAVRKNSVSVVLSDHHYWGGLQRSRLLAAICDTFGMGLSMHSNSHLGISLAAMTHLAAATPNLTYACETHWPWKTEDVVKPGVLGVVDGAVPVPTGPGLGVEIDEAALERLHQQYLDCGLRDRDDTGYMTSIDPSFENTCPRW